MPLCVDLGGRRIIKKKKVIKRVWERREDDGFFRVMIIYGEEMREAPFRVEDIDQVELTEFIKEVAKHDTQTRC